MELAKSGLDMAGAVLAAEKLRTSLQGIEASLAAREIPSQAAWKCIMEACEVIAILSTEKPESLSEEHSAALSSLEDAKMSLFSQCPKLETSVLTFIDFLNAQWPNDSESSELTLGVCSDFEALQKDILSPVAMAGARAGVHV